MVITLHSDRCRFCESGYDEHGPELQGCDYYFLSETSQVVLVSLLDSFNQPVHSETFEDPGDLVPGFANQNGAKTTVLPVVFGKAHIVDGRFDAQNHPQFVIHLDRNGTHVMLNPSPFDSGIEVIPDLSLIGPMEFSSQEGCYLLGFDGVDRGMDDRFIERAQIALVGDRRNPSCAEGWAR